MNIQTTRRYWRLLAAVVLASGGCTEYTGPRAAAGVRAPVTITATLTPAQQATIAGMSVEVTGPGLTTPILVNLSVTGATVNGTVSVPVGASRTFTVRAFDAEGTETYNGSATATVVAGTNPPLMVRMAAVEGNVPIDVTIGTYGVTLTPPTATVTVNGEVTLTANATTNGVSAPGPLTWGVLNPALVTLTVASDGRSAVVRGRLVGSTRVVASYEGVAAASTITITGAPPTNQPPVARSNGPYSGTVGSAIAFSSSGSSDADGSIVSYVWNFGDGTTSTQANPTKVYTSASGYTVTLTVTDDAGASTSSSTSAIVIAPPTGTFAATSIVAGDSHTCALTTAGAVFCWGKGTSGQLGNGVSVNSAVPVQVLMPAGVSTFTQLRAGGDYTCAYDGGGSAYCWGLNSSGQLGVGDTQNRDRPTKIMVGLTLFTTGGAHACGNYLGTRACWGSNEVGQIASPSSAGQYFTTPQALPDPTGVSTFDMVAGGTFTCFYRSTLFQGVTTRFVSCRGTGASSTSDFTLNQGASLGSFRAGAGFACANGTGTGTWCWGDNSAGQFGGGSYSPAMPLTNWTPTALGGAHACGTLATSGATACAGNNINGQLGDGSTTILNNPSPVIVSGGNLSSLAAGGRHTCGLRSGMVFCWGDNTSGQLGDGTTTQRRVPTGVAGYSTSNQVPTVSIGTQFVGRAGEPLTISASGSDADGTIVSYTWLFSDQLGTVSTATGSVTRTWTTAGTYQVAVAVTDNRGAISQSRSAIVTIQP